MAPFWSSILELKPQLVQACLGPTATGLVSGAKFHSALQEIYNQNGLVDRDFINSAPHHFNSEAFLEGRALITEGMAAIKANIRKQNFQAARETLGRVLHTLQDFYSHSNWVELGYKEPYINLIRPDLPLEDLADVNTPTCKDCPSGTCTNSILSTPLGQRGPPQCCCKCSHGGQPPAAAGHPFTMQYDVTVRTERDARMMGIARSSVVCFVIDTTGSMADDIAEARATVNEIIDSKKGTQDEPSEYILVPFNDPAFGPPFKTTDPNKMKEEVAKLTATGGGDVPEMCLSGLQLALTNAPASSNIYVFTDATAKDIALKDTIVALIRSSKSTVSFLISAGGGRRRRSLSAASSFEDYIELALASGGQAIQVSKAQLPEATDVIIDTSTSALVKLFKSFYLRHVAPQETFPFMLDESLKNITVYLTGTSISFILTNPAGVSQSSNEATGKLGTIKTVGNLRRIRFTADIQTGTWKININSNQPYTLKVTGQSTITFIYEFVERFGGPHPGYAVLSGRPQAGTLHAIKQFKGFTTVVRCTSLTVHCNGKK
uniref:von Willebrand factor A domain containing 11 n=1 Tax=Sander lucioperca TaxID=283035 RepID=A0A8C9Y1V7_SANLU